jgi:hypothetical protein
MIISKMNFIIIVLSVSILMLIVFRAVIDNAQKKDARRNGTTHIKQNNACSVCRITATV